MDPAGVALGAISLAIQLGQVIDTFVRQYRNVPIELKRYRDELKRHETTLQQAERLLGQRQALLRYSPYLLTEFSSSTMVCPPPDPAWTHCTTEIRLALEKLREPDGKWPRKIRRIRLALSSVELRHSMDSIHRYCEQFAQYILMQTYSTSMQNHVLLKEIFHQQRYPRQRAFLDWLSPRYNLSSYEYTRSRFRPGITVTYASDLWMLLQRLNLTTIADFFNPEADNKERLFAFSRLAYRNWLRKATENIMATEGLPLEVEAIYYEYEDGRRTPMDWAEVVDLLLLVTPKIEKMDFVFDDCFQSSQTSYGGGGGGLNPITRSFLWTIWLNWVVSFTEWAKARAQETHNRALSDENLRLRRQEKLIKLAVEDRLLT